MSAIFLSYRRDDSSGYAGRLFDNLAERFDRERVFMDIETLEPGMDFVTGIDRAIDSCGAVIAMIGPNWVKAQDSEGRRRLDNPHDFIRLEITSALKRGVRVIPVLVHNASMPPEDELPEPLQALCRLQACEISDNRWEFDVRRLADFLEPLIAEPEPASEPTTATKPSATSAGTQATETRPPASGERLPDKRPTGLIATVAILLIAISAGGWWWFSQPPTAGPQIPGPTTPSSPPPQSETARADQPTKPRRATDSATDPATQPAFGMPREPEPPPILEPAAEPEPPAGPSPAPPSAEEQAEEQRARVIAELLGRAEADVAELRLTRPAGNNAYERYRRVLELDPGNPEARHGVSAIIERYHGLVEEALGRGALDTAQRHLESAAAIDPGVGWRAPLQGEIERRRRQAARPAAPAIAEPRARESETRESGLEACLTRCEQQHQRCREEIDPDAEANCLRSRAPACEQRYEACMSDSSKLFVWGPAGLESECASVHADCERSAAKGCAAAPQTALALCDRRLDQCSHRCRTEQ